MKNIIIINHFNLSFMLLLLPRFSSWYAKLLIAAPGF
jgi:hypothetical protein